MAPVSARLRMAYGTASPAVFRGGSGRFELHQGGRKAAFSPTFADAPDPQPGGGNRRTSPESHEKSRGVDRGGAVVPGGCQAHFGAGDREHPGGAASEPGRNGPTEHRV